MENTLDNMHPLKRLEIEPYLEEYKKLPPFDAFDGTECHIVRSRPILQSFSPLVSIKKNVVAVIFKKNFLTRMWEFKAVHELN